MAKYTADIEIAVRGGQLINNTIRQLNRLNNSINVINKNAKLLEGRGFNVASIENYSRAVSKAERAVRKAAEGTDAERRAITQLVSAMELENKARERKNILIAREVANQRRVISTANAGVGLQGPALPSYMLSGPRSPIRGSRSIPGSPAALAAAAAAGGARPGGFGSRIGGAVSGSIIGGAFPLLFGQSGGAAAGGAIGGLAGGLAGPGGSFAGALLGTLLGDIASKGNLVKQLGEDIGFSAQQTVQLQKAFKLAGADAEKFTEAVQNIRGIGLAIEDQAKAIQLVSNLTQQYGGNITKTTNALTGALESGKVTQATLNQLTSQGITIQDALAAKYKTSRDNILAMAKDGKISVQDLLDTLVDLANKGSAGAPEVQNAYEIAFKTVSSKLQDLASNVSTAFTTNTSEINAALESETEKATNGFTKIVDALTPLIVKLAEVTAKFIDLGIQAAAALLSIPGYVETVANGVLLMIPGLQSVVSLLGTINALTGGTGRTGQETGMYGRYIPGSQQQAIRKPIGRIPALSQLPPSGGGGGGGRNKAADNAARLEKQIQQRLRGLTRETELINQITTLKELQATAELAGDKELQVRLEGEEKIVNILQRTAQELDDITDSRLRQAVLTKAEAEVTQARQDTALRLQQIESERTKKFEEIIADLDHELKLKQAVTEEARQQLILENEIRKLKGEGFTDEQLAAITARKQQLSAPDTQAQSIQKRIETLKEEIKALTDIGRLATDIAGGVSTAFMQAFTGLVTGAMSAREALASFFQSVGDMFISMATEIIAKQMTMFVLQKLLGALGGGLFGGGGGAAFSPGAGFDPGVGGNIGSWGPGGFAANGATFTNRISAFAKGGIVGQPTLFKFADGGATRTGLMGEAGPEAIMPLKRDGSGRLGVNASGLREAMAGGPGASGGTTLNMSFETTNIAGVEYVSRDQLEQAMAQTRRAAANDGAQRGMTMTLDRIKQSPQTRSRIGIR